MDEPIKLAEQVFKMSQQYNVYCKELAEIKKTAGTDWLELRKETTTDKGADKAYDASEKGSRSVELKFLLEGLGKEMSAAKSLVYAYQSHNF